MAFGAIEPAQQGAIFDQILRGGAVAQAFVGEQKEILIGLAAGFFFEEAGPEFLVGHDFVRNVARVRRQGVGIQGFQADDAFFGQLPGGILFQAGKDFHLQGGGAIGKGGQGGVSPGLGVAQDKARQSAGFECLVETKRFGWDGGQVLAAAKGGKEKEYSEI